MVELVGEVGPISPGPWREGSSTNPLIVAQGRLSILSDLVLACLVFFGALIGLELALAVAAGGEGEAATIPGWALGVQRALLSVVTCLLLFALLWKNRQSAASVGARADGALWACLWGVACYLAIFGYLIVVSVSLSLLWPGAYQAMRQAQEHNLERIPDMGIAMAAGFSLMVAVSEEAIFRGFIVTRLRALCGSWTVSLLVSSGFFAALHIPQGVVPVVIIFGLSFILGLWFVWRRNVIVPIVAHMLFDTTSIILMRQITLPQ